jgi:hypothetical protein
MNPQQRPVEAPFGDVPDPLGAQGAAPHLPERPPGTRLTRAELRVRGRLALAIAAIWLSAGLGWFGVRGDLALVSAGGLLLLVVAPVLLAVLCLALALSGGRLGIGARLWLLVAVATLPQVFLLSVVPLLGPAAPGGPPGTTAETILCFGITLAFGFVPVLAAAFALRRAFAAASRWRSALVGSAAGFMAAALINLHCDRVGELHVMLGHLGAAVALTLLGGVLLARATRA